MKIIDEPQESEIIKPRKPFLALFLSFVIPGWGQLYNGEAKKGALLFGIMYLSPWLFGMTKLTSSFWGLAALLILEVLWRIYGMVDAYRSAKKRFDYQPKTYNYWTVYLLLIIMYIAFLSVVEFKYMTGVESFTIPTPSSEPTIHKGDFLISDLRAYYNKEVAYGDIVSFELEDGLQCLYRVIALPNDEISIENHIPIVNGLKFSTTSIEQWTVDKGHYTEVIELLEEVLPNGHRHQIYRDNRVSRDSEMELMIVPEGNYFLMGDNRHNAADSRYKGTIRREQIQGQIIYAYWGASLDRMGVDFREQ
jgi:signal peptidase I